MVLSKISNELPVSLRILSWLSITLVLTRLRSHLKPEIKWKIEEMVKEKLWSSRHLNVCEQAAGCDGRETQPKKEAVFEEIERISDSSRNGQLREQTSLTATPVPAEIMNVQSRGPLSLSTLHVLPPLISLGFGLWLCLAFVHSLLVHSTLIDYFLHAST